MKKSPFKDQTISGATTTFTSTTSTISSNAVANINMHQLSTINQESNLSAHSGKGIMFTIYAKQEVVITGFDIKAKRKAGGNRVEIFTLDSDYEGQSIYANEWKLLYDGILPIQRRKVFKLADFQELIIPAGMTQSFYIYTEKGLMYSATSEGEGEVYGNDGVITIHKGSVTMQKFTDQIGMGLWLGVVRYYI